MSEPPPSRGLETPFLFVLAQAAAAPHLKAELGREHPELRLAYSRPGLFTFKSASGPLPERFALRSVFARRFGLSFGKAEKPADLESVLRVLSGRRLRLHVTAREAGHQESAEPAAERVSQVRQALLAAYPERFHEDERSERGDTVVDVIIAPEHPAKDGWLVGVHYHERDTSPWPGGVPAIEPPEYAPSRAYSKLAELLVWSGIVLREGETALELGAAPGGASVALLERGVNVIAVDPGDMDPRVAALAEERGLRFEHLALAAGKLDKSVLPPRIDYLLSDMNLAPPVALRYVARLTAMFRGSLRGAFLTLKLNDQVMIDALPSFTAKLAELGLGTPRLVQLPSHRQEVAAVLPGVRHSRPPARKRGLARR